MKNTTITRRDLLKRGLVLTTGLMGSLVAKGATAASCFTTPSQQEGPFYPEGDLQRDADLTRFNPGDRVAEGEQVILRGKVQSTACVPLSGAIVEIWQACASGRYNHSEDPNNLPLDPNFQYWGRCLTSADGGYQFRTIIPGHYPVSPSHTRPPHIHMKVHAKGSMSLTTQLYFDPKSYDDPSLAQIVKKLNAIEQVDGRLIVHYQATGLGAKLGSFDVTL